MADPSPDAISLLQLVEEVVELSSVRLTTETVLWKLECYQRIFDNFNALAGLIKSGDGRTLGQIGGGAGLGASRALCEWGLPDDQMRKVVGDAESFFMKGRLTVSK